MSISEHLPRSADDVCVRRLRYDDADAFAAGTKDADVQRYGHLPLTEYTPEVVRDQIDGVIAQGLDEGFLAVLAVADARSDEFLGSIVVFDFRDDRAEVGFWLAPRARGRGAAQKALRTIASVAESAGLAYLDARTAPENKGSRRVLEGANFVQTADPHEETAPSGEVVTVVTYERALCQPTR